MPKITKKSPLEKADPDKELEQTIVKMLELKVEVPSIEEAVTSAQQALAQAQMATKQKQLKTHNCTECGSEGVQLYHQDARNRRRSSHFKCYVDEEDQFCDEHGEPFTDPDKLEALRLVREKGTVE